MTPAYQLTQENQEIVVRINKEIFTQEKLTRFLDYLTLESIGFSSQLSQEEAEQLANEIDGTIWQSIQNRILGA